jgi:hypothetical protein
MGSALPADTEASDTPDSVYREHFPDNLVCNDGDWKFGYSELIVGFTPKSLIEPRFRFLRADTYPETVCLRFSAVTSLLKSWRRADLNEAAAGADAYACA